MGSNPLWVTPKRGDSSKQIYSSTFHEKDHLTRQNIMRASEEVMKTYALIRNRHLLERIESLFLI